MDGPVYVPGAQIADNKRMLLIRPNAVNGRPAVRGAAAQVEGMAALAVGFIILEADERQGADIDLFAAAVRLLHGQLRVEVLRLGGLEEVAILVALGGHVAGEG